MLRDNQLHETVMKVWHNDKNRSAMARAFAAHHQIVCAILNNSGDNNYLSKKGRLSFGIWRIYQENEAGDGIIVVDLAAQHENETAAGIIVNENRQRGLKYSAPDLRELENMKPTDEMKELLMGYVDEELMTDDVREIWTRELLLDTD